MPMSCLSVFRSNKGFSVALLSSLLCSQIFSRDLLNIINRISEAVQIPFVGNSHGPLIPNFFNANVRRVLTC